MRTRYSAWADASGGRARSAFGGPGDRRTLGTLGLGECRDGRRDVGCEWDLPGRVFHRAAAVGISHSASFANKGRSWPRR